LEDISSATAWALAALGLVWTQKEMERERERGRTKERREAERVGAEHEVGGQNSLNAVEFQLASRDNKRTASVYDADPST